MQELKKIEEQNLKVKTLESMINVNLDELCPQTRRPQTRKRCLKTLTKNLDGEWRKTQTLAKAAGVKLHEIQIILKYLKALEIVESKHNRHTYWRIKLKRQAIKS